MKASAFISLFWNENGILVVWHMMALHFWYFYSHDYEKSASISIKNQLVYPVFQTLLHWIITKQKMLFILIIARFL